jgi:hypothetical protein
MLERMSLQEYDELCRLARRLGQLSCKRSITMAELLQWVEEAAREYRAEFRSQGAERITRAHIESQTRALLSPAPDQSTPKPDDDPNGVW